MKLSEIVVDVQQQEEGVWRSHPYFDGVDVLVRSVHCKAYRQREAALWNRLPRKTRKPGEMAELIRRISQEALAECVLGWRGIEDDAGAPLEFDAARAREWAEDHSGRYRRWWEGVRELADEIGQAEDEAREESLRD